MIEQLATAATYGFGASFGRDLYKAAKRTQSSGPSLES